MWRRAIVLFLALIIFAPAVPVLALRWIAPPTTAFIQQERADGAWSRVEYVWTDWRSISKQLPIAVVASEDQKFPYHQGFDFESISKAVRESPERPRGASTITQQVAKNLFLWPGRSLFRKGVEAYLTLWIEVLWPKQRILEVYLNVAEFGPGVFGVGAASRFAFGKRPSQLTGEEAALLAAVLPSPKRMSAARPSQYVRQRASEIQRAVARLGGPGYLAGF